jgi:hypothetical protein
MTAAHVPAWPTTSSAAPATRIRFPVFSETSRANRTGDRRRARDQEEDGGIDQVKAFIQANMDPAAFAKLEQMLEALNGGGGEEESPADDPRQEAADPPPNGAQDDPENFKGEPLKGGKMAGDARPRGSYFDSFPGNRRVYVLDYGSGR